MSNISWRISTCTSKHDYWKKYLLMIETKNIPEVSLLTFVKELLGWKTRVLSSLLRTGNGVSQSAAAPSILDVDWLDRLVEKSCDNSKETDSVELGVMDSTKLPGSEKALKVLAHRLKFSSMMLMFAVYCHRLMKHFILCQNKTTLGYKKHYWQGFGVKISIYMVHLT